jgi:PEP-CTERM motif
VSSESGLDYSQAFPVPEPGTMLFMLAGLGVVARQARWRSGRPQRAEGTASDRLVARRSPHPPGVSITNTSPAAISTAPMWPIGPTLPSTRLTLGATRRRGTMFAMSALRLAI